MIDLHTHTNESDGSSAPSQLVAEAKQTGLQVLAITDHDTLAGYEAARPAAARAGLELICGIELSTKFNRRSVHLLGYFLNGGPSRDFQEWLREMQESRRDRNRRLAARLRSFGMDIQLEEVEAKGRRMTGRPHFAKVMVEKGYVANTQQAFDEYLDESARGYVDRLEPQLAEGIQHIRGGGGIAALPHPIRLAEPDRLDTLLPELLAMGLEGLEVYHSDHTPQETEALRGIALRHGLIITGGSDYHGDLKPGIPLGTVTQGNQMVPLAVLEQMKEAAARLKKQLK